ncbi:hypothetical protein M3568_18250 [Priestia flexa]|uniref:nucleoside transporter C-terminal domain-containing protein n=1 Tax=Priestia flexa TaxID=86664 RepID=UPI002042227B|nr:nucleoside transporter C-terminal domain-containing protein [Priestia flexa]MCM3068269.1 hypothetical protein [Priestia flexa]
MFTTSVQEYSFFFIKGKKRKNNKTENSVKIYATLVPFAIIIGIPFSDALQAASIIGTKLAANEFVAYLSLTEVMDELSPKTVAVLSIALCNFANFSSIGQLIIGLGSLAPSRRKEVSKLSLRAIIGGTLASFITAILVGVFM